MIVSQYILTGVIAITLLMLPYYAAGDSGSGSGDGSGDGATSGSGAGSGDGSGDGATSGSGAGSGDGSGGATSGSGAGSGDGGGGGATSGSGAVSGDSGGGGATSGSGAVSGDSGGGGATSGGGAGCPDGWKDFKGNCYKLIVPSPNITMNFKEAEDACKKEGGSLASVHSPAENKFLKEMVKPKNQFYYWLGLKAKARTQENKERTFSWSDGTIVESQPKEKLDWENGIEYCIQLIGVTRGKGHAVGGWNEADCAKNKYQGQEVGAVCKITKVGGGGGASGSGGGSRSGGSGSGSGSDSGR